jgi:heptosyltransferase-2
MDSERLKRLDRVLGDPLILLLAAFEWLRRLAARGRAERGRDLSGIRRIAVVKTVAIGDLVVALPTIAAIRRLFPKAHLTLVTTPRVREVVEGLADVDDILYFDVFGRHRGIGGVVRFAREVRARRFGAWVELEHYYRFTTVLGYLSGAKTRAGFAIPGQARRWLMNMPVDYPVGAHEVEAFYSIARELGAPEGPPSLIPIPTTEGDEAVVDAWLARALPEASRVAREEGRLPVALIHATTSPVAVARRWIDDRWVAVARRVAGACGLTPILTGAPEDAPALERLAADIDAGVVVAAGALSLKQFAVLASRAALVISLDTGPLHVAAAAGAPTVGIFGPNTPAKWGPYGPGNASVWAALECAPCTRQYLGQVSRCDKDDCMRAISVDMVLEAIATLPASPCPGIR